MRARLDKKSMPQETLALVVLFSLVIQAGIMSSKRSYNDFSILIGRIKLHMIITKKKVTMGLAMAPGTFGRR